MGEASSGMPIYTYRCPDGHQYEFFTFKSLHTAPEVRKQLCTKCGKEAEIAPSETSFILKGGGWAKDGYGKG